MLQSKSTKEQSVPLVKKTQKQKTVRDTASCGTSNYTTAEQLQNDVFQIQSHQTSVRPRRAHLWIEPKVNIKIDAQLVSDEDAQVKVMASHISEALVAEGDFQNTISIAPRPSIFIVRLTVH